MGHTGKGRVTPAYLLLGRGIKKKIIGFRPLYFDEAPFRFFHNLLVIKVIIIN